MYAAAFGIGTKNAKGEWLEVYYPRPIFKPQQSFMDALAGVSLSAGAWKGGNADLELNTDDLDALFHALPDEQQTALMEPMKAAVGRPVHPQKPTSGQPNGGVRQPVLTILESDEALQTTPEAYLKLHLLSHRFVLPNAQNLDGIYPLLPNVAWTEVGAVDLNDLEAMQLEARAAGRVLEVAAIDKFPKMTNYVVPPGVRIAHSARVRLGAYLGDGTTVMHEGFINFNAGALGPNMIEGRISQGVTVGAGSDLGGSASTIGTLSGGGNIVISIGQDCLIGANAGTGIPLGDRCTIESGLFITAGTVVQVMDEARNCVKQVKARELAGESDLLFIRNSQTGQVECRANRKAIELNQTLHSHN